MSLFKKPKEQNPENENCCCKGSCRQCDEPEKTDCEKVSDGTRIKILGSGCSKCNELEANTKEALKQLGIDLPIEKVTDFAAIAAFGVMTTPALVIDEKVVSYGKVLKVDEIKKLVEEVI